MPVGVTTAFPAVFVSLGLAGEAVSVLVFVFFALFRSPSERKVEHSLSFLAGG